MSFLNGINNRIALDHHDLGFLYTPSCTAEYRINGDVKALEATIKAADKLMVALSMKKVDLFRLGENSGIRNTIA